MKISDSLKHFFDPTEESGLLQILDECPDHASFYSQIHWIMNLFHWIRRPIGGEEHSPDVRLRYFLQFLNKDLSYKKRVAKCIQSCLTHSVSVQFFAYTGLPSSPGFWTELYSRLVSKVLPTDLASNDLSIIFLLGDLSEEDATWIDSLKPEYIQALSEIINFEAKDNTHWLPIDLSIQNSLIILASDLVHLISSSEVRSLLSLDLGLQNSCFLKLFAVLDGQAKTIENTNTLIHTCRANLFTGYQKLDHLGLSVSLIYQLEKAFVILDRLEELTHLVYQKQFDNVNTILPHFLARLVKSGLNDQSIRHLIGMNIHYLTQKVVEHNSTTGEHYIARDLKEYGHMFRAALGGGFLTIFTILMKFILSAMPLAIFFEWLLNSLNYALSFQIMQFMKFSLATKQPSMTATALASKLDDWTNKHVLKPFAETLAIISRSQVIAIIGNLGAVIPAALLLNFLWIKMFGTPFLTPKKAHYVIESLHPLKSLTLFYATLTGIILWLSSFAAGLTQNWIRYQKISLLITNSPFLNRHLKSTQIKGLVTWVEKHSSGISSNFSLGFLLGAMPFFGRFFGVPLDVRHITLSTGSFALAVVALPFSDISANAFRGAIVGLGFIAVLNFGVSFMLSNFVAITAKNLPKKLIWKIIKASWVYFLTKPWEFFVPVKVKDQT